MDSIERGYRTWWGTHTPEQRADMQRVSGHVNPRELNELTTDVDGLPLGVETTPNPDSGMWVVPAYVLTWDPNDDDPITLEEL